MDPVANPQSRCLPFAFDHLDALCHAAPNRQLIVFLDYDGTLTPIVPRPEDAYLPPTMYDTLSSLASALPVAVISGRDLADVKHRINIDSIYYAGSHGFDIAGPGGFHAEHEAAASFLPALEQAAEMLRQYIDPIPGAQLERKRFAIAVHYRRVSPAHEEDVRAAVTLVSNSYPDLRLTGGKKILELRPQLDWHKGKALFWLIDIMGFQDRQCLPIYIGDDVTDEDAFQAIRPDGIGILVCASRRAQTAARYRLQDIDAVGAYLNALLNLQHPRGTT
jgi:trehalose 6-phosphate phosphatase